MSNYITPKIMIEYFHKENIVTDSSIPEEYLPELTDYQYKAQVSFNDLIKITE